MREGWEVKKIDEVCDNLDNQRIPITKNKRIEGAIPYYGASGIVDYVKDYIFDEDLLLVSEDGANLLARTYPIAFSISGKNWVNNHAHVLKFDNMDSQKYIEYYFNSIKLDDYISGMAQPKLNQKMLNSILIPIPPLPEQKQIVKTLDLVFKQIDQAKANLEKNLANAKELFASKLNEVFSQKGEGWEEKKLGDLCKTGSGGTPLKSKKEYYDNGTIPWLCSGEVKQGDIYKSKKYITEIGFKNSSAKLFPSDTVLIAMYGATAGEVGILRFESSTNQAICGILPNDKLLPKFIYYSFLFRKKELIAQATGNAQPNISQIKIKNTLIPLLEKSKQINIIELLDNLQNNIDFIQTHYQQNLNNLEELKKSILEKAFKGEL